MPNFGKRSREQLDTCSPQIKALMKRVVENFDISILEGHRDQERQDKLYDEGKSKLKYPEGNHNNMPSNAVDIQPYPFNPKSPKAKIELAIMAGYVRAVFDAVKTKDYDRTDYDVDWIELERYKLRWGGDWDSDGDLDDQTFDDYYHFEIIPE